MAGRWRPRVVGRGLSPRARVSVLGRRVLATVQCVPHRDVRTGRATPLDVIDRLRCARALVPAAQRRPRRTPAERAYPGVADEQAAHAEQRREDRPPTVGGRHAVDAGADERQAGEDEEGTEDGTDPAAYRQ